MIGAAVFGAVLAYGAPAPDADPVAVIVPRRTFVDDLPQQVECTAVLVAERLALTAGHCVEDYGRGTLELHFGPRLGQPEHSRLVREFVLHPEYSPTHSAFDLAALWLDEPVAAAPWPIRAEGLGAESVGAVVHALGFATQERRQGQVVIEQLAEGTITYAPGPDMTCRGDSGGPVVATIDGTTQIIGITSAGDMACESWGAAAAVDERVVQWLAQLPEPPATGVDEGAACAQACTSDAQCPHDLVCTGEGRCAVRGLPAGELGGECSEAAQCDLGPCVAMGEEGRCLESCDAEPAADETSTGCRIASDPGAPSGLAWLLCGLVAWRVRRIVPARAHAP